MKINNHLFYNKKNIAYNINIFHFAIIVSEWNSIITEKLLTGAINTFYDFGIKNNKIKIFKVPGSFELIFSTSHLSKLNKFDAIIAIGCIIQGETKNFHYISSAVTHGIKKINIYYNTPVIFCVLTDNNIKQSFNRSGGKKGNKGTEAAISAIKMAIFKHDTKK